MGYASDVTLADLSADPAARAVVERHFPGLLSGPGATLMPYSRVALMATFAHAVGQGPQDVTALLDDLAALDGSTAQHAVPVSESPAGSYEPDTVPVGSARLQPVGPAEQWRMAEISVDGPAHANPFTDVEFDAEFRGPGGPVRVGGFYDGEGTYRIRFRPPEPGTWQFETRSNARSLDGLTGTVEATAADPANRGQVVVQDGFHFRYQDGTPYLPLGTTVYALTHQDDALQDLTLRSLARSPFTKLRLCIFPKSFFFNTEQPPRYPYARTATGEWDFARFDVGYFRHFEQRLAQLQDMGVQADVILFHPYDRWGFSRMPAWADDLYVRYVVRRLQAFSNVWWSLANEYDFMAFKNEADWERIAAVIKKEDPVGHLISIHNGLRFYDYRREWITHCSIQRVEVYRTAENVDAWREQYRKPVVIDECGYEGDIDMGWGNISGLELVRRCWEGAVRGGYVNHGETYVDPDDVLWWSKGGVLRGESPERIGFLARLIAEAPSGRFDPLPGDLDAPCGGDDDHRVIYFGFHRPAFRPVITPPGSWYIDVIDTWQMTVNTLPGTYEGRVTVPLPGREYQAIRLRRAG